MNKMCTASEHPIQETAPCKGCEAKCSGRDIIFCFTRATCHQPSYSQIRHKMIKIGTREMA